MNAKGKAYGYMKVEGTRKELKRLSSTLVFSAKSLTSSPQPWQQLQPPWTSSSFFFLLTHTLLSLRWMLLSVSLVPASLYIPVYSIHDTKCSYSPTLSPSSSRSRTTVALHPTIMVAGIIWKRDENRNWKIPLRANVAEETRITTPHPVWRNDAKPDCNIVSRTYT